MVKNKKILIKVIDIIFFVLLMVSLTVYYFRSDPYIRPTIYFYILSVLAGIVAFQIILVERYKKWEILLIIFEIFLISILFTSTQQALYKTVLSRDPWTHGALVSQILIHGHIPPYNAIKTPYASLPNFHLLISLGMLASGISYKWGSYIVAGLSTEILLMFGVYLFSIKLFKSKQLGIIAVFLMSISDNVLDMVGKNIVPNSIGVALAILIAYFVYVVTLHNKDKIKGMITICILIISLSFFHTLSYGMLIMLILIIYGIATIFSDYQLQKSQVTIFIMTIFIVAFFVWGIWDSMYLKSFVILIDSILKGISYRGYSSKLTVPITYVILARIGMIIYAFFVGIGSLVLFPKAIKNRNINTLIIVTSTLTFWGIGVFSFLNPEWSGIAHRFWYVGEVLGSIVLGLLIIRFRKIYQSFSHIAIPIIIGILAFLMFVANVSNDDNPLVPQYSTRTGWYDSEICSGLFALKFISNPIASDWDYIMNLNNLRWTKIRDLPNNPPVYADIGWIINPWFPKSFQEVFNTPEGKVFIFRKCLLSRYSFWLGPRWGMIQYTPLHGNIGNVLRSGNLIKNLIYSTNSTYIWE